MSAVWTSPSGCPARSTAQIRNNRRADRRGGFSLLELILVMAILLMFAALSLPSVQRSFTRQSLSKGADLVRAGMGQARVRAIRTGRVHALFYLPDTGYYTVAPFDQAQEQASFVARRMPAIRNRAAAEDFADDLLPRGIRFAAAETEMDARAAEVLGVAEANSTLRPILFYPDGTSQDAQLILQNPQGESFQILLRGLTGTSTANRVNANP